MRSRTPLARWSVVSLGRRQSKCCHSYGHRQADPAGSRQGTPTTTARLAGARVAATLRVHLAPARERRGDGSGELLRIRFLFAQGHLSEKLMNDAFSGLGIVMLMVFLVLSWILSRKLERIVERS